jgi:hypothetical protein
VLCVCFDNDVFLHHLPDNIIHSASSCCCSSSKNSTTQQQRKKNLDRPDPGYSPLWNILWATEMPINYSADQFSNAQQASMDEDGSFVFFQTPMYVNCPDIGLVGDEMNTLKLSDGDEFMTTIALGDDMMMEDTFTLIGTSPALIFAADEPITFVAKPSGDVVGETTTNIMGGYEYDLEAAMIPDGTTEIVVMYNGESIRTIMVVAEMADDEVEEGGTDSAASAMTMAVGGAVAAWMMGTAALVAV